MRGKGALRVGAIAGTAIAACGFNPISSQSTDGGLCVNASTECVQGSDVLRTCPSAGATYSDVTCGWGCTANGQAARCFELVPSGSGGNAMNGVGPGDVGSGSDLTDLTLAAGTILDGDTGQIGPVGNPTSVRPPGTGIQNGIDYELRGPIAMFRVNSLMIAGDIALAGSHPIALVVDGHVEIDGEIDARGTCAGTTAGPGGFAGGTSNTAAAGSGGGGAGAGAGAGGGAGGGYGGNGGGGGYMNGSLSAGGAAWSNADLALLQGGGGGGGGGANNGGLGGGGGGALQVVSNMTIVFGAMGAINAGGCGGNHVISTNPGGGGGAGGAILLEAPTVVLGILAANGGGGAGGDVNGTDGAAGKLGTDSASGGTATTGGIGGAGGAGNNIDGGDAVTGAACAHCGGGGGSVGRIRMNTHNGTGITTGQDASTSPSASTGSAAVQ